MTDENGVITQGVSEAERALLLEEWQRTSSPYDPNYLVHRQIAAFAAEHGEKTALCFENESLSYADLDAWSDELAVVLRGHGVGPDVLVGVCIQRSIVMVVALLAVFKAGGAYVPLDPAYPRERLSMMLEDGGIRVLMTQKGLVGELPIDRLPGGLAGDGADILVVDDYPYTKSGAKLDPPTQVSGDNLAYVIFTSGSTGRPKGVMVEHRNMLNFFTGMDQVLGTKAGVWLAVTSISFDISVLELFWTLSRGFTVVIQAERDRASLLREQKSAGPSKAMGFGLFYFAADSTDAASRDAYRILTEGARFADEHGFAAVWTPERHFHAFGGLYPNAAVTSAALAVLTKNVEIRAGSVVLPLHNPIRVAEDWAVVDNLSGGRVGLSFASGWHANDFALMPDNYERRREIMHESIATVLKLWRGEKIKTLNGEGKEVELSILPRPVREHPPMWIASAGTVATFEAAGRSGHNVLTNMLGQDLQGLKEKFAAYRRARKEAGHEGEGIVSVMLHTFVCADDEEAKRIAKEPFCNYLASSYDLVKVAPWMFPAFRQPSQGKTEGAFDAENFDDEDMRALLDHAFERYFDTAGLFGTPERALALVNQLKRIGANEVACLVDFGIAAQVVLDNLVHLDRLRQLANEPEPRAAEAEHRTTAELITAHGVTHLQCTPSNARLLLAEGATSEFGRLEYLLLGGEALPPDLVSQLAPALSGQIVNMYGPTETTVWSTFSRIRAGEPITIGRPLANTIVRILDANLQLCPIGATGELYIGGDGVTRGYLGRDDLTAERFISDPFRDNGRLYKTGDLARYLPSGELEYLGRIDQQVKLNGYRMELGEIETILARHPLVGQAVVAVKGSSDQAQLVGYFVPQAVSESDNLQRWGRRWNEAYERRIGLEHVNPRFDHSGWLSSFTGTPLPAEQMRQWLDSSLERILALEPKRVLELGCGTGMILFGCLSAVDHYVGLDLSAHALSTIDKELSDTERARVVLQRGAAHELDVLVAGEFDLVIINSVAQYFPSADYLAGVLTKALDVLRPGGHLFVGDVRSLSHLEHFSTLVEVHQAPEDASLRDVKDGIASRMSGETELLLSPAFFERWMSTQGLSSLHRLSMKDSSDDNEMSLFRYDVVFTKRASSDQPSLQVFETIETSDTQAIVERLRARPAHLLVSGVENGRLTALRSVMEDIRGSKSPNVASLRALLDRPSSGLHPSQLRRLDDGYEVELRWGRDPNELQALFRRKDAEPLGTWLLGSLGEGEESNVPASAKDDLVSTELRRHLAEFLPVYMIPSVLVEVPALPLTPNGKIDRQALPEPHQPSSPSPTPYTPAANELEATITGIWQQLLGVERVGTRQNIFELGASSLMTVEANTQLQQALGKKIPLVNMFRYPTIEKLAAFLAAQDSGPAPQNEGGRDAAARRQERLQAAAERRRQARARLQS